MNVRPGQLRRFTWGISHVKRHTLWLVVNVHETRCSCMVVAIDGLPVNIGPPYGKFSHKGNVTHVFVNFDEAGVFTGMGAKKLRKLMKSGERVMGLLFKRSDKRMTVDEVRIIATAYKD